jgi:hypothetical protein
LNSKKTKIHNPTTIGFLQNPKKKKKIITP